MSTARCRHTTTDELTAAEAAAAKLFCTETAARVIDRCLQLHGGYGYINEYPIARLYADNRVTRIYGGTSEVMKMIIAKDMGLVIAIEDTVQALGAAGMSVARSLPDCRTHVRRTRRLELDGRVVFVTGAARGIGAEVARQAHSRGARVALVGRRLKPLQELASQLGEGAVAFDADVRDLDALQRAADATVARFGGIDVVVANAGIAPPSEPILTIDPAEFERTVDIDLLGQWRTVRATLPAVIERRGHILVVASIYSFVNGALNASYAASKAGVDQLTRALRVELAHHGATAGVAYLGFVETDLVGDVFAQEQVAEARSIMPEVAHQADPGRSSRPHARRRHRISCRDGGRAGLDPAAASAARRRRNADGRVHDRQPQAVPCDQPRRGNAGAMSLIAPQDAAFLLGETAAQPTHVAGLAIYELPPGAEPDYVSGLYRELLTHTAISPRLRQRPADPVGSLGNVWWTEEHDARRRVPRAACCASATRTGARTTGAGVPAARPDARQAPPAVGVLPDRGARGRPLRHLHQGASRALRRRRIHSAADPLAVG